MDVNSKHDNKLDMFDKSQAQGEMLIIRVPHWSAFVFQFVDFQCYYILSDTERIVGVKGPIES